MTPKSCAHMRTTSPWGVAAKWPAQALKMKLIPGLRDPQGYSHISLSLSGRILKEYQNILSAAELPGLAIRTGKYAIFLTTEAHVPVGLLYCDESTEVSRLVDFVFCFSLSCLIKLDWSTTELQWCWISHFFCVPWYKLLLYITSKVVSNVTNTNLLSVNASRILFTRCVGASVILKAFLFCCCYCWKSASHIIVHFVSGVLQSA